MSIGSNEFDVMRDPATRQPAKRLVGLVAGRAGKSLSRIGRYSAFVGVMRFALPLVAVLLLGLVVVWPLVSGREEGFRVTYSERVQQDGSLKMLNARYIGTDSEGQPYTITAEEAIPSAADAAIVTLKNLKADMFNKDGSWSLIAAREGLYNRLPATLDLAGDVAIHSDRGDELRTQSAHIEINEGRADGDQPISGQGPLGLIEGTGFSTVDRGANILIRGPVKVTVFPKRQSKATEGGQ